jgi:hypothetical protein
MSYVVNSSPLTLALSVALFFSINLPSGLCAQSNSKQSNAVSQSKTVARKLTPEQERGLRLLKTAVAESSGSQPDMHSFVLWQASHAYATLDPKQADKVSRDAFTATLAIEDRSANDRCAAPGSAGDIKSWIQQRVLSEMVHKDHLHEVEVLLPQATPSVRNEVTTELVRYYESKKDLMHAENLLALLAASGRYPFGAAADLVTKLGPEHSADRMSIFNQALNNFEHNASQSSLGDNDIGSFIERTWKDVPPGLVLEAITKVLEEAKEGGLQSHYSMSSARGSVVFDSDYSVRLFQLLPILEELDKDKAEELLREHTEVAEQLKTYPRGMESVNSENTSYSYGGTGDVAAKQQNSFQMRERIEDILKKADTDPDGALARALALPIHGTSESYSPRSDALLGIAEKSATKNASVSKSALDEFSTIQDQLTPREMIGIDKLPELYLKIGDLDGARKAVDVLVKAAGKVYEKDTDTNDPNRAFKGAWPSTNLWRDAIKQAATISPSLPEEVISGLPDADIVAFEKVALASTLVGGSAVDSRMFVADCRKNRVWGFSRK